MPMARRWPHPTHNGPRAAPRCGEGAGRHPHPHPVSGASTPPRRHWITCPSRSFAPASQVPTPQVTIRRFQPDQPLARRGATASVSADLEGLNAEDVELRRHALIAGRSPRRAVQRGQASPHQISGRMAADMESRSRRAHGRGYDPRTQGIGRKARRTSVAAHAFLPPVEKSSPPYIPEPVPAPTSMLVGAHHCPLWEADKPQMWLNVLKHPERTPVLGFYAQENPEVSDWETKWAVEHGISFFVYCWYRTEQGGAVKTQFGSAIHDALFKSRFVNKMKFTLMWENQLRGKAGVADEEDLFTNLLPYWMENYFKHPSYLKVDNKPVLFIYRPEFLIDDLGGVTNVANAFERMRQVCRESGFDGLYLLGEYRGTDPKHLELMKSLGLDYTFAYCWYVHDNPTPERAIQTQMDNIRKTQELNILPQVVTVSQAWSGWQDEGTIWKIPPPHLKPCCGRPRSSQPPCRRSNSAVVCSCSTTGMSGAKATISRPIENMASAIWTRCAKSSPPRQKNIWTFYPKTFSEVLMTRQSAPFRNARTEITAPVEAGREGGRAGRTGRVVDV